MGFIWVRQAGEERWRGVGKEWRIREWFRKRFAVESHILDFSHDCRRNRESTNGDWWGKRRNVVYGDDKRKERMGESSFVVGKWLHAFFHVCSSSYRFWNLLFFWEWGEGKGGPGAILKQNEIQYFTIQKRKNISIKT